MAIGPNKKNNLKDRQLHLQIFKRLCYVEKQNLDLTVRNIMYCIYIYIYTLYMTIYTPYFCMYGSGQPCVYVRTCTPPAPKIKHQAKTIEHCPPQIPQKT
jgi:hypothetical protein